MVTSSFKQRWYSDSEMTLGAPLDKLRFMLGKWSSAELARICKKERGRAAEDMEAEEKVMSGAEIIGEASSAFEEERTRSMRARRASRSATSAAISLR